MACEGVRGTGTLSLSLAPDGFRCLSPAVLQFGPDLFKHCYYTLVIFFSKRTDVALFDAKFQEMLMIA
jgi:hypothetical protein